MPTDVFTFAAAETTMRYRQPFTTEGLNQKLFGVQAPGNYRGFILGVDGGAGDRTLNIEADPITLDNLAVVNTSNGYSLTLRHAGDVLVDLSSYASVTVVVTVRGTYSLGATTASLVRVFTLAEYDALSAASRLELVVLGTVVVPASGVIAAASIKNDRRSSAFLAISPEVQPWTQIVQNGYFELSVESDPHPDDPDHQTATGWNFGSDDASVDATLETTAPFKGSKALELNGNTVGTPTTAITVTQYWKVPTRPGKRVRVIASYDVLGTVTAGAAVFRIAVLTLDAAPAVTYHDVVTTAAHTAVTATTGGYVTVDAFITIPAGAEYVGGVSITLVGTAATYSVSPTVRVDDVRVYVEPEDAKDPNELLASYGGVLSASALELFDLSDGPAGPGIVRVRTQLESWLAGGSHKSVKFDRAVKDQTADEQIVLSPYGIKLGQDRALDATTSDLDDHPLVQLRGRTAATFTLLMEFGRGSTAGLTRIYQGVSGDLVVTSNARWDPSATNWVRDGGTVSTRFSLGNVGGAPTLGTVNILMTAAASPFVDSAWFDNNFSVSAAASGGMAANVNGAGYFQLSGTHGITFAGPGVPATPPVSSMRDVQGIKAIGHISGSGGATPTINWSYGLASVATSSGDLVLTFARAFESSDEFVVVCLPDGANFHFHQVLLQGSTTTVNIRTRISSTGAAVDWAAFTPLNCHFIAIGPQ